MRPRLAILAATLAALLVPVFAAAPSAQAAGCPNEAIREAQGVTYLPDCRAYELVNAPDKNDSLIDAATIAPGGDHVLYLASTADIAKASADRVPLAGGLGRWTQHSMLPPADELVDEGLYSLIAVTPDRMSAFFNAHLGLLPPTPEPPKTLLRLTAEGTQTVFATIRTEGASELQNLTLSADGAHVFANLQVNLSPEQAPGTFDVFDLASQPPILVSRLPDGSVPSCGTSSKGFAEGILDSTERDHWTSLDGSRIFFLSPGSGSCAGSPLELYRRDTASEATQLISGPALAGDSDATFLRASGDGSEVVYMTTAKLLAGDENEDADIYRWTEGAGNICLTCVVSDAEVQRPGTEQNRLVGVSEDLSHVYFISTNALAPGSQAGELNLYVLHAGAVDFIAPAAGIKYLVDKPTLGGELTADGNVLVFSSDDPALNPLSGSENGGTRQYYRYDDRDHSLACLSCPASGPATHPVPEEVDASDTGTTVYIPALSADGSRFFFTTEEALLPRDEDGAADLYEWHDGRLGLITDGVSETGNLNRGSVGFHGISADGRDVLFSSTTTYASSAVDHTVNLFDARIGGGEPPAPAPPICAGEACKGAASNPVPPLISHFSGPADPTPEHKRCSKRKPCRHHKHKHKRHRHHRRKHGRANANRRAAR